MVEPAACEYLKAVELGIALRMPARILSHLLQRQQQIPENLELIDIDHCTFQFSGQIDGRILFAQ